MLAPERRFAPFMSRWVNWTGYTTFRAMNVEATTLCILLKGRFRLQFPEQEFLLSGEGDYVLWPPGVPHCWSVEFDSTVLTIRWPSKAEDSVQV